MFLVERLDSLIANGTKLPFSNNVVVDQLQAQELLDQLRAAVPEEVRQAKRINQESERILERAQEEAEHIKARAQEQAAFLIGERGLTQEEAVQLLVNGFVKDVLQELPMEFAVEAQKLVAIGLEGSVG